MKDIGSQIQRHRLLRGLSRAELAERIGVSTQTIINVERDPSYNLCSRLLERLGQALDITFEVTIRRSDMKTSIIMGNDEFILYIRKNYPECEATNDQIGKKIWNFIKESDTNAEKLKSSSKESVPCLWGNSAQNLGEQGLPQTATQFSFSRALLPTIYDLLDAIGEA